MPKWLFFTTILLIIGVCLRQYPIIKCYISDLKMVIQDVYTITHPFLCVACWFVETQIWLFNRVIRVWLKMATLTCSYSQLSPSTHSYVLYCKTTHTHTYTPGIFKWPHLHVHTCTCSYSQLSPSTHSYVLYCKTTHTHTLMSRCKFNLALPVFYNCSFVHTCGFCCTFVFNFKQQQSVLDTDIWLFW